MSGKILWGWFLIAWFLTLLSVCTLLLFLVKQFLFRTHVELLWKRRHCAYYLKPHWQMPKTTRGHFCVKLQWKWIPNTITWQQGLFKTPAVRWEMFGDKTDNTHTHARTFPSLWGPISLPWPSIPTPFPHFTSKMQIVVLYMFGAKEQTYTRTHIHMHTWSQNRTAKQRRQSMTNTCD